MTSPCGLVAYAVGSFTEAVAPGWSMAPAPGPRSGQQLLSLGCDDEQSLRAATDDALALVAEALSRWKCPAENVGTDEPAGNDLDRLELVWHWRPDTMTTDWRRLRYHLSERSQSFLVDVDHPDPWRQDPTRPQAWHRHVGDGSLTVSCTTETRSLLRLWLLSSRRPYAPGQPRSLLDLCETDTSTGSRGSLARYALVTGQARHFLMSSIGNDVDVEEFRHDSARPVGTLRSIRDRTAKQRIAAAGVRMMVTRALGTATDLADDLHQLSGAAVETPPPLPPLPFPVADQRQMREAIELVEFNENRMAAIEHQLAGIEAHDDNIATGRATRATSLATTLLAVTAGAVGAAQLADDTRGSAALALTVGGTLLAIGVLVLDSTTAATRAHLLGVATAGAAVGTGVALLACRSIGLVLVAAVTGAVIGALLTVVAELATFSPRSGRLRRWLLRPATPSLHGTRGNGAADRRRVPAPLDRR